jgi:hypothetical protein
MEPNHHPQKPTHPTPADIPSPQTHLAPKPLRHVFPPGVLQEELLVFGDLLYVIHQRLGAVGVVFEGWGWGGVGAVLGLPFEQSGAAALKSTQDQAPRGQPAAAPDC